MKKKCRWSDLSVSMIGIFFLSAAMVEPAVAQDSKTKIRISYPNISICCLA